MAARTPASARAHERKEQYFAAFAARAPLLAAMTAATDATVRRAAAGTLSAYDAPWLVTLRGMQRNLGGIWEIDEAGARDAVLAAIQLEAVTDAEGDLIADSETAHKRVAKSAGMDLDSQWCGSFTVDHFRHSKIDSDLTAGFFHVDNVEDFFRYKHDRNLERTPRWSGPITAGRTSATTTSCAGRRAPGSTRRASPAAARWTSAPATSS